MREILFRGKHKDIGWVYGYLNQNRGDSIFDACCEPICGGDFYIRDWLEKNDTGLYGLNYKIAPQTIGQYTGLTDKNGKKIFEGDIVRTSYITPSVGNETTEIVQVVYDDERCCFYPMRWNESCEWCGYYTRIVEIEIIGNIHDNPELLNVKF